MRSPTISSRDQTANNALCAAHCNKQIHNTPRWHTIHRCSHTNPISLPGTFTGVSTPRPCSFTLSSALSHFNSTFTTSRNSSCFTPMAPNSVQTATQSLLYGKRTLNIPLLITTSMLTSGFITNSAWAPINNGLSTYNLHLHINNFYVLQAYTQPHHRARNFGF